MARTVQENGEWVPLIVTLLLGAVTLIVYPWTTETVNPVVYAQVAFTACVPLLLPLIGRWTRKEFPVSLNALIASHMVLASFLGSAMQFYRLISWWDLLMHGYFGLVGGAVLYVLLRRWGGDALDRGGFWVTHFLAVMGSAALWEIFEYVADALLGGDAQRVAEALRNGTSPIADTMTDILITAMGAVVFDIGIYAVYRCRRFTKKTR